MKTLSFLNVGVLCLLLLAVPVVSVSAQFGGLAKIGKKIVGKAGPSSLVEGKAPITTSIDDAVWGIPDKDSFTPRDRVRSMNVLQRTKNGGFLLKSGYYRMQVQSYCLHAGTYGPGGGDGYLYAPPKGSAADAVESVVRNSVAHPEINQHDVQTLLWAIVARAKFEDLSSQMKLVAAKLLNKQQLATLNRNALDMVPGPVLDKAMASAPAPARAAMQAEAKLRYMLTKGGSSYTELERVAVLSGNPPRGKGNSVPSGRWSMHPDGYYVRYIPSSYSSTRVEIWIPEGSSAVGREFDPATHIAVPADTGRQRLIQSGRQRQEM